MRKLFTITAGIVLTLMFTTCKQFEADIDKDFSYWSGVVFAASYEIDKKSVKNGDEVCIPSASNVTVTIKLRNPQNFRLVMPPSPLPQALRQKLSVFPVFRRSLRTLRTIL